MYLVRFLVKLLIIDCQKEEKSKMKSLFLNQAIENINTINWMNNHERTEEEFNMDVVFVKEFFKRLSLFLDFLSVESKYPYIDPVKLINKESGSV
jgi:hypothetical protein